MESQALVSAPLTFSYCPLNESDIRLLLVHPSGSDLSGAIRCTIFHVNMKQISSEKKAYRAVSYTWGDPAICQTIFVNNCALAVRKNLWDFLDAYRRNCTDQDPLWIDQICVDQGNINERNHQVKLMSQIYSTATLVLSWIGGPECNSGVALGYLQRANKVQCLSPSYLEKKALESLFQRVYWSRLWIIQEILLAREVFIMCGELSVDWNSIILFYHKQRPHLPSGLTRVVVPPPLLNLIQLYDTKQRTSPNKAPIQWRMVDILDRFASCMCQDPRDKVFGLMALVSRLDAIEVDYKLTAEAIFVEVMKKMAYLQVQVVRSFAPRLRRSMGLEPLGDTDIHKLGCCEGEQPKRKSYFPVLTLSQSAQLAVSKLSEQLQLKMDTRRLPGPQDAYVRALRTHRSNQSEPLIQQYAPDLFFDSLWTAIGNPWTQHIDDDPIPKLVNDDDLPDIEQVKTDIHNEGNELFLGNESTSRCPFSRETESDDSAPYGRRVSSWLLCTLQKSRLEVLRLQMTMDLETKDWDWDDILHFWNLDDAAIAKTLPELEDI